jgi:hypothetical protein
MCQNALPQQEVHCFDNFSLSMYRAFMSGISNFIDENPGLDQLIREKMQFADTDILRLTNVEFRMCQFLEHTSPLRLVEEGAPRATSGACTSCAMPSTLGVAR